MTETVRLSLKSIFMIFVTNNKKVLKIFHAKAVNEMLMKLIPFVPEFGVFISLPFVMFSSSLFSASASDASSV